MHGLPSGTFDGTFAAYEREIHPDDRARVLASARRAIEHGVPYEVEYRIVAPDGTIRWVEGKGRVEYEDGRPVRMTGVCMMVTRRKEAELARLASAEEASRLKDEFLATLSHELRTPLNAILGWVQMLQTDGLSPDRVRQAFDIIGRNAKLQAQLIEDILDVSRIITGKLEIDRVPVRVDQLLDTAISGVLPAADGKQIRSPGTSPPTCRRSKATRSACSRCFGNVLSNAIKFTPEDGLVTVVVPAGGGRRSRSRFATQASASHPSSCPTSSIGSGRPTAARRGSTAGWAWVWHSPATWSNSIAATFTPRAKDSIAARPCKCDCRLSAPGTRFPVRGWPTSSRLSSGSTALSSSLWTINVIRATCLPRSCSGVARKSSSATLPTRPCWP